MRFITYLCLAVLLLSGIVITTSAQQKEYADDELIIQFTRDAIRNVAISKERGVALTGLVDVDVLNERYGVSEVDMMVRFRPKNLGADERTGLSRYHVIKVPAGSDIEALASEYSRKPGIEQAYPNYFVEAQLIPNDTNYPNQWGLNNTGQADPYGGGAQVGTPGADINAEAAWDITTGSSSIILAIIDSGVDYSHPEFSGRTVAGWDFVNDDDDPMDDNGHGTSCAGIASAAGNNGFGVAGVSWESLIMGVKVLDSEGSGTFSDVAAGITFAVDNGANILSMSLGASVGDAAVEAAVNYAHDNNVLVVASRGNGDSSTANYPASYSNVMAVIALSPCNERKTPGTCDGEFWWGSSYGSDSDVSAPGTRIWTTDITGSGGYEDGDYMSTFNGTSSACPFVAGVAALVWANEPGLSNDEVRDRINATAVDINSSGFDSETGWGRADAHRALTNDTSGGGEAPVVSDIPDEIVAPGDRILMSLNDFVSDPDNADGEMTWSWSGNTSISIIYRSSSQQVRLTIPSGFTGPETITFTATDPHGNSGSDVATYSIDGGGGGGDAPVVSDIASQTIEEGETFSTISLDDFVTDPDHADSELSWSFSGNSDLTVSIDDSRIATVTYPVAWTGSETVTFTATDPDGLSDNDAATFTVNSTGGGGDAPVVSDIPDQTITNKVTLSMNDFVDDPDHADSELTWTWSGNSSLTVQYRYSSQLIRVTAPDGWSGSETITFTATDPDGNSGSDAATFSSLSGSLAKVGAIPQTMALERNYPNPFNPETEIRFQLSASRFVEISIYNALGQKIRSLVGNQLEAGHHTVRWNGRDSNGVDVSSGIYLYQMTAGDFSDIKKMTLLR
jgi:subtilisin family serine protease